MNKCEEKTLLKTQKKLKKRTGKTTIKELKNSSS